jgi:hypothetical protein
MFLPNRKHKGNARENEIRALQRKEFFYKLRYLITLLTGDPAIYKLIPEDQHWFIFYVRYRSARIVAAPDADIPPGLMKEAKELFTHMLRYTTVSYTPNGPKMSLDLFFTLGMSLFTYLNVLKDDAYPGAKQLKAALKVVSEDCPEDEDHDVMGVLLKETKTIKLIFPILFNDPHERIFWVEEDTVTVEVGMPSMYQQFTLNTYKPRHRFLTIDGISRPMVEACWGFSGTGINKVKYTRKQLGLKDKWFGGTYPVYVQSHAFIRLYERLDCFGQDVLFMDLYMSLRICKIYKQGSNPFLIEYYIENTKLGYLVADIHEGIVVVHTFLFLTQNGTPEGQKLQAVTGLGKLDKEFLAIDKLSTFHATDIEANEEIKQLFIAAGCGSLFEFKPAYLLKDKLGANYPLADRIRHYLKTSNTGQDMETYKKEQMPGMGMK